MFNFTFGSKLLYPVLQEFSFNFWSEKTKKALRFDWKRKELKIFIVINFTKGIHSSVWQRELSCNGALFVSNCQLTSKAMVLEKEEEHQAYWKENVQQIDWKSQSFQLPWGK